MDKTTDILVISTSLNPGSISRVVAEEIYKSIKPKTDVVEFVDMQAYNIPHCNGIGNDAYEDPTVKVLHDMIANAKAVILAATIYNYNVGSPVKNLIELTGTAHKALGDGSAWRNKLVGFVFGAGTPASMLAGLPLLNSMLVDFKCILHPNFIHMTAGDLENNQPTQKLLERMNEFEATYMHLFNALNMATLEKAQ